ncbi:MAG: glycosyltransferase [Candidatus Brocadiaceae bacterium]|nr:glycosyltransferase [Candidatus Brocadiaceae bacterium]
MKIFHLFDQGSRQHQLFNQGLMATPNVLLKTNNPYIQFGTELNPPSKTIFEDLLNCDLIFRCGDLHFTIKSFDFFMDENDLWEKTIYYDFKDSPNIEPHRLLNCKLYCKRSVLIGEDRLPIPKLKIPILPIDYAALDEYYLPQPENRTIDLAYLCTPKPFEKRRMLVYRLLKDANIPNSIIGNVTKGDGHGRKAIFYPRENNSFIKYLQTIHQSKIVFTAFPDNHDGDSRIWEAFASGALVFMDTSFIPTAFPLIDKEHCIQFDATNAESVRMAISQAKYYLKNENEEKREKIANAGYHFVKQHHHAKNRIEQIFKWLASQNKKVEEHVISIAPNYMPFSNHNYQFTEESKLSSKNKIYFMGIGAQKAGTTWLHNILNEHPNLYLPKQKELHFFNNRYPLGITEYLKQFPRVTNRLSGEITPAYSILGKNDVKLISELFPELKIIFTIRNPIDRLWSSAKMDIKRMINKDIDFNKIPTQSLFKLMLNPIYLGKTDYLQTINNWYTYFPKEQFHIIIFDDIKYHPEKVASDLSKFLNISPGPLLKSNKLTTKVFKGGNEKIPEEIFEFFFEHFKPYITTLEEILNIDLSEWKTRADIKSGYLQQV